MSSAAIFVEGLKALVTKSVELANSKDPDGAAHNWQSCLDLHCFKALDKRENLVIIRDNFC